MSAPDRVRSFCIGAILSLFIANNFKQVFYSGFNLAVAAADVVLWSIVDLNVRHQQLVLEVIAAVVLCSHLGNTERVRADILPPYCSHGTGYGCANQFADSHFLIKPRRAVRIGIVVFADQHTRGFYPSLIGVIANKLASGCVL